MTHPQRWFFLLALTCSALSCLLFLAGLPGDFLFDDYANIVQNNALHLQTLSLSTLLDAVFDGQLSGITRAIPTLSFALDYWRNGLDPAAFKTTNIIIHALTTFTLAWFFRALLQAAGIADKRAGLASAALALAWALHPLQVSSVLYVVQRIQTLSTLFVVLALLAYLHARRAQMEGKPSRRAWLLVALTSLAALASKEDAVLLPAYALAMELTVLRFAAADTQLAARLRKGYLAATLAGTALYLLVVVPHYWSWAAYGGRDFSTPERLLTQARVLAMYLWQIVVPLPSHMPFYYDWLQPSRGLLHPWTTLPALLLIACLLGAAWKLRIRRPIFSLGVLLFFTGHFVTSNVIGLELAYEHRNSFPLIGAVLAIGDLLAFFAKHLNLRPVLTTCAGLMLLAMLASAAVVRAQTWSDRMTLAQASVQLATKSLRAWNELCVAHFHRGGGFRSDNPYLGSAIAACNKATTIAPDQLPSLSNVIVFKAVQGTLTPADWSRYLERIQHIPMTSDNRAAIWPVLNAFRNGAKIEENRIFEILEAINMRAALTPIESAAIGYFILSHTHRPDRAYPFFARAVQNAKDPSFPAGIIEELRKDGHGGMAEELQALIPHPDKHPSNLSPETR